MRSGRVYVPPDVPFGWFDAPLPVNRLSSQWLARLLHPKRSPEPLGLVLMRFRLHYHREPSEAHLHTLPQAAGLPR